MSESLRKKSPRAPSVSLEEALSRVFKIYEKEGRHEAPIDAIAQDMGYKGRSGAALGTIASLTYYGLLKKPKNGFLNVSIDVEKFKFSPEPEIKQALLNGWLKAPQIFSDLLNKFTSSLPSDATLKYELIQMGFTPVTAEDCLSVFKKSVEFVGYYNQTAKPADVSAEDREETDNDGEQALSSDTNAKHVDFKLAGKGISNPLLNLEDGTDRIPIRLPKGRKAWIEIPSPFFEADKIYIKKQVDLIFTDDES